MNNIIFFILLKPKNRENHRETKAFTKAYLKFSNRGEGSNLKILRESPLVTNKSEVSTFLYYILNLKIYFNINLFKF